MNEMSGMLQAFVEDITRKIVDHSDDVVVDSNVSTKELIIQIRVNAEDCGKIIGKKGKTIESLKTICLAIKNTQFKNDTRRLILAVLEDENSTFSFKKS